MQPGVGARHRRAPRPTRRHQISEKPGIPGQNDAQEPFPDPTPAVSLFKTSKKKLKNPQKPGIPGQNVAKAVRKHAGKMALIQRCQMHKRRNVTGHLPQEYRASVDRKMANAYAMSHYGDAKKALGKLHGDLRELNPSAARSLEEGMEETLTVHRLGLDDLLRSTLATTNPIESEFSVVGRVCGRVTG